MVSNSSKRDSQLRGFCLQNVLIQMGLHVLSVNGMVIRQARNYILRCHACFKWVRGPRGAPAGLWSPELSLNVFDLQDHQRHEPGLLSALREQDPEEAGRDGQPRRQRSHAFLQKPQSAEPPRPEGESGGGGRVFQPDFKTLKDWKLWINLQNISNSIYC